MITNILGQTTSGTTATTDKFMGIGASGATYANTTITANAQNVMPCSGTLQNFYVQMTNAFGVGGLKVFTIQKNGVDSTIVVSPASGQGNGNDTTHTLSFVAGDVISIHATGGDGVTSTGSTAWAIGADCGPCKSMLLSGSGVGLGTTFPAYVAVQGNNFSTTQGLDVESVMPTSGIIKNAYLQLASAIASGKDYTFTLYQNGSPTSLAVTINTAVATGNDTTHSIRVAAGDTLYWRVTSTVAPATKVAFISLEFDPDNDGESVHMFGSLTPPSQATGTKYNTLEQSGSTYSTTEPTRQTLTLAATWKKLYVVQQTAIAAGSYQYQLSKNAIAGNPSVTMTSGTTGNDTTNTVTSTNGNTISMLITTVGTATSSNAEWGIVSFIQPTTIPTLDVVNVNQSINRAGSF